MPLLDMLVEVTLASVVLIGVLAGPICGGALYVRHRLSAHEQQRWREQRLSHERR